VDEPRVGLSICRGQEISSMSCIPLWTNGRQHASGRGRETGFQGYIFARLVAIHFLLTVLKS
jgi:hypothetical protein